MTETDADLSRAVWRKSSRSGSGNQCVEVARVGTVRAIRNSRRPNEGTLIVDVGTFKGLIGQTKDGAYDLPDL